jgi:hypothetical protein
MLRIKNRFTKGKGRSSHPYDEPTFLSFFLMFDFTGPDSPLFNGTASKFLREVLNEHSKADDLDKFKNYLQRFNREMPWMWQQITGIQYAYQYGALKDPYPYAEGNELVLTCLETLDFTVAGMFDLYKSVVLDSNRMVEILPGNLRQFQMFVHVQDIRNFMPFIGSESMMDKARGAIDTVKGLKALNPADRMKVIGEGLKSKATDMIQDRLDMDTLDWRAKGMGPRFVTQFKKCRFDWDNTTSMFEDINNVGMENEVKHKIKIRFNYSAASAVEYLTHYNYSTSDPFKPFDGDLMDQLKRAGAAAAEDLGNQALTSVKAGVMNKLEDFKNGILLGNVYGANGLSKMQDAFNSGSLNAIKPMLAKEDPRTPVKVGMPVGENINHGLTSPPEIDLESTKIFEDTLPETPLESTNILPPRSSEQDADTLGNALSDG